MDNGFKCPAQFGRGDNKGIIDERQTSARPGRAGKSPHPALFLQTSGNRRRLDCAVSSLASRPLCGGGRAAGYAHARAQSFGPQAVHVSRQGQEHYLSLHGRGAFAPGFARLQTQAATVQRPTHSPGVYERPALRLHQRGAAPARLALQLSQERQMRRGNLRTSAPPAGNCRRHCDCEIDQHHAVQSRPRSNLHELRFPDHRPPQHGLVAHLWPGK